MEDVLDTSTSMTISFCLSPFLVELRLTCVQVFISPLHDGSVNAGHQPCSYNDAAQQPQDAVAEPHHHVVEKEEVVEAVERLPEEEKGRTVLLYHADKL